MKELQKCKRFDRLEQSLGSLPLCVPTPIEYQITRLPTLIVYTLYITFKVKKKKFQNNYHYHYA